MEMNLSEFSAIVEPLLSDIRIGVAVLSAVGGVVIALLIVNIISVSFRG